MLRDTLKTRRRTETTIEIDEVLVLRHRIRASQLWCSQCSEQVPIVNIDQAGVVAGVSSRTIYRWVEADQLHFTETPKGLLLVCLNSIPQSGEAVARLERSHSKEVRDGELQLPPKAQKETS